VKLPRSIALWTVGVNLAATSLGLVLAASVEASPAVAAPPAHVTAPVDLAAD